MTAEGAPRHGAGHTLRRIGLMLAHGTGHIAIWPPGRERYSTRALEAFLASLVLELTRFGGHPFT